ISRRFLYLYKALRFDVSEVQLMDTMVLFHPARYGERRLPFLPPAPYSIHDRPPSGPERLGSGRGLGRRPIRQSTDRSPAVAGMPYPNRLLLPMPDRESRQHGGH